MPAHSGPEVWSTPRWLDKATAWLDRQLAAAWIARTGEVEQPHLRPWATVLKAPTSHGTVWLKAAGPGTAFEVGLYELLHRVAPDHALTPLAVDRERDWMLLPDGGTSLGERLEGPELVQTLTTVLPQYAELQRDLAPHADALLRLGLTDMRAAVMPRRLDEALAATRPFLDRTAGAEDRETYERVASLRPTIVEWCEELATATVPASIDHNDLHPWNILGGPAQARFYDWGDSVVAHPFASMLVAIGFVQFNVLGCRHDDPRIVGLRDAYLEPFADFASHSELVRASELACRVAKIARALTWDRAVRELGRDLDERWARAPFESLASLLDESYLGRT